MTRKFNMWNANGEVPADRMSALTGGAKKTLQAKSHCIVEGEIAACTGADGKHYGIKFQLRLPEDWNRRFILGIKFGRNLTVC